MKSYILLSLMLMSAIVSHSQEMDTTKNWTTGGNFSIDIAQSSFTNWAAGGQNALSATSLLNTYSNYKKGDNSWDNILILGYGILQSGTSAIRKNEDKIDLSSKYGRYAFYNHWYYTALVNFKSQFADGYNFPNDSVVVSQFLAPGYVLASLGMDYKSTDNSLSVYMSPITARYIIVNNQRLADQGAYGVRAAEYVNINGKDSLVRQGEKVNQQFGGYLKLTLTREIMKNINLTSRLELFSNYLKNPENVVVNWENIIVLKVNKYISSSLSTVLIYDHAIPVPVEREMNGAKVAGVGPRLQFKQVFALGFSYKF